MKRFHVARTIHAPPESVWAILADGSRYREWDPNLERFEGRIAPGEKIKVYTKASPGRAFPITVTCFEPARHMVWTGGMPLGLFKGERTFSLSPASGGTDFTMEEVFTGPLAPLIGRSIPDLQPSFERLADALKARAESRH